MSAAAGPSRGSGSVASGSTPTSPKKKNKRQRETSAPGYTGPLVPTNNGKGGPVKMPLVIRSGYAIPGAATKVAKQRAKHVVSRMSTSQTGLEPVYDQEILREFGVEIDVSTMSAKQIRRKRDRMYRERQAQADLPAGGKSNKLVIRELKRQQKMAAAKAGQASSGKGPTPSASGSREGSSRSTLESSPQGPNEGEDAKEEESARPPRRKRGKKAKSDVIDLDGESIVESVPKDSQAEPDPMFVEDDAGMPAQAADRLATLPAGLLSNFMSGTDIQQASSEVDLSELDGIPVEETGEAPMPFEHSLPSTPAVAQQEAEAASSLFTIDAEPAPVKGSKTTEQTGDLLPDEILLEAKGPVEEIALDEGDMKGIINDDNTRATAVKRYYDDEDGPARPRNDTVKCGRCGEQGHIAKDCEHQQCMTCGAMDDHEFRDCPLLKVCWRCGNKGHTNGKCNMPVASLRCPRCNQKGHASDNCPTIWRVYPELPLERHTAAKPNPCCYNCGHRGHFGEQCPEPRGHPVASSDTTIFTSGQAPTSRRALPPGPARMPHLVNGQRTARPLQSVGQEDDGPLVRRVKGPPRRDQPTGKPLQIKMGTHSRWSDDPRTDERGQRDAMQEDGRSGPRSANGGDTRAPDRARMPSRMRSPPSYTRSNNYPPRQGVRQEASALRPLADRIGSSREHGHGSAPRQPAAQRARPMPQYEENTRQQERFHPYRNNKPSTDNTPTYTAPRYRGGYM